MNDSSGHEVRFRYKSLLTILAVFSGGLILLLLSQGIDSDPTTHAYPFSKVFLEHLATALLAGACISGLYEYFLRLEFLRTTDAETMQLRETIREMAEASRTASHAQSQAITEGLTQLGEQAKQRSERLTDFFSANVEQKQLGISHCYLEFDRYDFSDTFEESRDLVVVMNDGRGLISNYYQRFANRFLRTDATTTVILMHPNSEAVHLHAAKVGSTSEGIRMKIAETIGLLSKANAGEHRLEILGHDLYNAMSVFLTEKEAIVTPYFLSKVRRTPPLFTFEDNGRESFYHKITEDVVALRLDCSDISSYTATDGRIMSNDLPPPKAGRRGESVGRG
jgi:hypothetical protein